MRTARMDPMSEAVAMTHRRDESLHRYPARENGGRRSCMFRTIVRLSGMRSDVFSASRDPYRCLAVSVSGRRCQLQVGHDGAHAHAWRENREHPRCGQPLPPVQLVRWDEQREWPEPWDDSRTHLRWQTLMMP